MCVGFTRRSYLARELETLKFEISDNYIFTLNFRLLELRCTSHTLLYTCGHSWFFGIDKWVVVRTLHLLLLIDERKDAVLWWSILVKQILDEIHDCHQTTPVLHQLGSQQIFLQIDMPR